MAGGPQLRNIGTIGGNVCNGVTSADSASSLCCLAADLVLKGPDGVREVPISQWYTGPGRTVRNHDEVLTAIRIKKENYQATAVNISNTAREMPWRSPPWGVL